MKWLKPVLLIIPLTLLMGRLAKLLITRRAALHFESTGRFIDLHERKWSSLVKRVKVTDESVGLPCEEFNIVREGRYYIIEAGDVGKLMILDEHCEVVPSNEG